jgi:hypothetical protein
VSEGLRWGHGILGHIVFAAGLLLIVAGVTVAGVLVHRPAWFVAGVLVVLVSAIFFEGTYRVGREATLRAQPGVEAAGLSLIDRLKLALKRGQGFVQQANSGVAPFLTGSDPAMLALARDWHDDIYKLLTTEGKPEAAKRWLDETEAVPAIPGHHLGLANPNLAPVILTEQVGCLDNIIKELETGNQG